jgi:hypothetical protein
MRRNQRRSGRATRRNNGRALCSGLSVSEVRVGVGGWAVKDVVVPLGVAGRELGDESMMMAARSRDGMERCLLQRTACWRYSSYSGYKPIQHARRRTAGLYRAWAVGAAAALPGTLSNWRTALRARQRRDSGSVLEGCEQSRARQGDRVTRRRDAGSGKGKRGSSWTAFATCERCAQIG